MFKINHHPIFDTEKVIEHYSQKDGVPIKYVCTSAIGGEEVARDIFYRGTPHPEFGNRYFCLFYNFAGNLMISSADKIEDTEFGMIEGVNGWEYSQHRHDYRQVGGVAIDGGRTYVRLIGSTEIPVKIFRVKDGEFIDVN